MVGRILTLSACFLLLVAGPESADAGPKKKEKAERYPPSFRVAVEEAITHAVDRLKHLQTPDGHFGNPAGAQALGHTALPTLAMLKAYHKIRPLQREEIWFFSNFALYAALAFWLSRLAVALGQGSKGLLRFKNPDEFKRIVQHHRAHAFYIDERQLL